MTESDGQPRAADPPRVVLHVGAMKTGTSTIQAVMGANADALAEAGVFYPCRPAWSIQVRAVRDALDIQVPGVPAGRWARMAGWLRTHNGPLAVLSMEFLSFADLDQARAIVESLAPAQVDAVLTLRDPARVLPSAWQEWMQNRGKAPWADYLDVAERLAPGAAADVSPPRGPAARQYRRVLDADRMISVWSQVVPPQRLHVVTVPPPGAPTDLLWERFASVLEIDPAAYPAPTGVANESLDYHAADLMWRVNRRVAGHLDFNVYESLVKTHLCKKVLATRSDNTPVPLPDSARDLAMRWARHTVDLVEQAGARVVGDLTELEPVAGRFTSGPVPPTDRRSVVDAARDALTGLEGGEPARLGPDASVPDAAAAVVDRLIALAPTWAMPERQPPENDSGNGHPADDRPADGSPVNDSGRAATGLLPSGSGGDGSA